MSEPTIVEAKAFLSTVNDQLMISALLLQAHVKACEVAQTVDLVFPFERSCPLSPSSDTSSSLSFDRATEPLSSLDEGYGLYSYGLYTATEPLSSVEEGYGLFNYCLHSYGLYSCGLYAATEPLSSVEEGYGLYSYDPYSLAYIYSYGLYAATEPLSSVEEGSARTTYLRVTAY